MNLYVKIICFIIIVFCYFCLVKTVVPEYCLQPLNRSDCGIEEVPVITYWKPGSRCEVDFWRGCPTYNKFENEYECSLLCIFKMSIPFEEIIDECDATFNDTQCTDVEEKVYTHINGTCVEVIWRGCETRNKFKDDVDCENTCVEGGWKAKLEEMSVEDLKVIDEIIDEVAQTDPPTTEETPSETESETTEEPTEEAHSSEEHSEEHTAEETSSSEQSRESEQHVDNA